MIKPTRIKDEKYRRWVASLPCIRCGIEGYSQCAHRCGAGMGTKASDYESFPLCAGRMATYGCHYEHDHCVGITVDERRRREDEYVARTQKAARSDGVIE